MCLTLLSDGRFQTEAFNNIFREGGCAAHMFWCFLFVHGWPVGRENVSFYLRGYLTRGLSLYVWEGVRCARTAVDAALSPARFTRACSMFLGALLVGALLVAVGGLILLEVGAAHFVVFIGRVDFSLKYPLPCSFMSECQIGFMVALGLLNAFVWQSIATASVTLLFL
ncbi:MAG: hypothetical protein ACRDCT_14625 [Shewanella sp.]